MGARIPQVAVKRLPVYLRALGDLARLTGFSSEQIRKDLAYFGSFGTRGVGYHTDALLERIRRVLGLHRDVAVALVGAGHLGTALARYNQGQEQHVDIRAIFDADPAKIGQPLGGTCVRDVAELPRVVREEGIRMGVVAVPAAEAQRVADALCAAGVEAILNFAPVRLEVPPGVHVENIDLSQALQALAFYVSPGGRDGG
jgi:redox-sensing transcriptional repressor